MSAISTPSPHPEFDDSLKKLHALKEQTSIFEGHKVTYIGGYFFRLEKAQSLAKQISNRLQSKEDDSLKTQLKSLQDEIATLELKLPKVIKVISTLLHRKESEWNKSPIEVTPKKNRSYLVLKDGDTVKITSVTFINRCYKPLGHGSYGDVRGDSKNVHAVAIKQPLISSQQNHRKSVEGIYFEDKILKKIHHATRIAGIVSIPIGLLKPPSQNPFLILEQFDGTLSDMGAKAFEEGKITNLGQIMTGFTNMFQALRKIHFQKIFHGDIKRKNIGVFNQSESDPLRLADWGHANDFSEGHVEIALKTHTTKYLPREILEAIENCNHSDDFLELMAKRDYYALTKCLVETLLPNKKNTALIFNMDSLDERTDPQYPSSFINEDLLETQLVQAGYSEIVSGLLNYIFVACHPENPDPINDKENPWIFSTLEDMHTVMNHLVPNVQKDPNNVENFTRWEDAIGGWEITLLDLNNEKHVEDLNVFLSKWDFFKTSFYNFLDGLDDVDRHWLDNQLNRIFRIDSLIQTISKE